MTGMEGRETEAEQLRKAHWRSWTLFRACGHSCNSFDTQLQSQGPTLASIGKSFPFPAQVCGHSETHVLQKVTHTKGQPSRTPGLILQRARNSKTASVWEDDLISIGDISVMILQCPALLSRQSRAGLDQMGLFRVWSWFLLVEIITPGCLKCMDCCGGQDETNS